MAHLVFKLSIPLDNNIPLWRRTVLGNNMINLVGMNKKVLVYFTPKNDFISISNMDGLERLVSFCSDETKKLFAKLVCKTAPANRQISLFDNLDNGLSGS